MIQRHFKCPDCGGVFWQTVEKRSAPPPDECSLCHGTGQQTEAALVFISKAKREADQRTREMVAEGKGPGYNADARLQLKSEEQVFRAMEAGSSIRAEAAASELNVSVSEVSDLKITDLRDNVKPGETSAKPLSASAQAMQAQAKQMSFASGAREMAAAFTGQGTVINGKAVGTKVGPGALVRASDGTAVTPGESVFRGLSQEHHKIAHAIESRPLHRG